MKENLGKILQKIFLLIAVRRPERSESRETWQNYEVILSHGAPLILKLTNMR